MATKSLDDLDMGGKGRFYNPRPLAGGLTFKGSRDLENGLFGMDFQQPQYGLKDWRKKIIFEFKKSVFFFENLLVPRENDNVMKPNYRSVTMSCTTNNVTTFSAYISDRNIFFEMTTFAD